MMITKEPMSVPPDDDREKENGPPLSANIETDHTSENAHEKNASEPGEKQVPLEDEISLVEFAEAAPAPLDPEDLTSFAISDNPGIAVTRKALTTVVPKKPTKESFVRTYKEENAWKIYPLLELKEEGKIYLLAPPVAAALEEEGESTLIKARLVPTVDRRGNLSLWPLKVSDRENDWHISAYRAATLAKEKWVRVQSNMSAGVYDTFVAISQESEPIWPDEDYLTILKIAFDGRIILSLDHPVLKELRGEF